jgi:hypothetical protein
MAKTPQGISAEEARTLLYQWIALILVYNGQKHHRLTEENVFWRDKSKRHRVINVWGLDAALYYLLCMNLSGVVKDFLNWDNDISMQYIKEHDSIKDSNTKDNEDCFRKIILKNFPEDMKYLLCINRPTYIYINSPGQPFTKPRLSPLIVSGDENEPIYLPEEENELLSSVSGREESSTKPTQEEFNRSLDRNYYFKELIDQLDLISTDSFEISEEFF